MKICITGPESTGKTTLTKLLSENFEGGYVGEYAREFLEKDNEYEEDDLLAIAKGQKARIESNQNALVFCDTGFEVIQVWSEWKYGRCDPWILWQVTRNCFDHYLLCTPDLPWTQDPLRENPHDRDELFRKYLDIIEENQFSHTIISGLGSARNDRAISIVEELLKRKVRRN